VGGGMQEAYGLLSGPLRSHMELEGFRLPGFLGFSAVTGEAVLLEVPSCSAHTYESKCRRAVNSPSDPGRVARSRCGKATRGRKAASFTNHQRT